MGTDGNHLAKWAIRHTFKMGRTPTVSYYGIANWKMTGAANYSVTGNTYNFAGGGTRNNSQFSYKTPSMNGFSSEIGYVFKADRADKYKIDFNAAYINKSLRVAISANKISGVKTNYSLGGKYVVGKFSVATSYTMAHNSSNARRSGVSLGASALFGNTSFMLDVTRDAKNEWGSKKYTNAVFEVKQSLSKTAFLYGAFLKLDGTNNYTIGIRKNF